MSRRIKKLEAEAHEIRRGDYVGFETEDGGQDIGRVLGYLDDHYYLRPEDSEDIFVVYKTKVGPIEGILEKKDSVADRIADKIVNIFGIIASSGTENELLNLEGILAGWTEIYVFEKGDKESQLKAMENGHRFLLNRIHARIDNLKKVLENTPPGYLDPKEKPAETACPECRGRGFVGDEPFSKVVMEKKKCTNCGGTGRVPSEE